MTNYPWKRLYGAGRDLTDNITQPRKAKKAKQDYESVKLARETKHVRINPQAAAEGDTFSQSVLNARLRTAELKREVEKRKKKRK